MDLRHSFSSYLLHLASAGGHVRGTHKPHANHAPSGRSLAKRYRNVDRNEYLPSIGGRGQRGSLRAAKSGSRDMPEVAVAIVAA
jgi:hypothetical protein